MDKNTCLNLKTTGPLQIKKCLSGSYTMVCPPVRGDNPQALAKGLSPMRRKNYDTAIFYHLISVDLLSMKYFVLKLVICGKGWYRNCYGTHRLHVF